MSQNPTPTSLEASKEGVSAKRNLPPETGLPCGDLMVGLNHPFFCSDANFHANDVNQTFATLSDFLDEYESMSVDLNLCFRWDIRATDEDRPEMGYRAEVFLMLQRKGIFVPCSIETVSQCDLPRFQQYLASHWAMIQAIWMPFSVRTQGD
jgi:hypothetical protein